MNALASYLRHLVVTGLLLLISKYKLPLEGAAEAADWIALAAIGTITWLVVKYAPEWAKRIGLLVVCFLTLPGCAEFPVAARVEYDQGALQYSPDGLVFEVDARNSK